jgi:hypothetical protein
MARSKLDIIVQYNDNTRIQAKGLKTCVSLGCIAGMYRWDVIPRRGETKLCTLGRFDASASISD